MAQLNSPYSPTQNTHKHIIKALVDLNIARTSAASKIKGLRLVIYQYILHGDYVSAMRQLADAKYQAGNRRLSQHLPDYYHQVFNDALEEYIVEH